MPGSPEGSHGHGHGRDCRIHSRVKLLSTAQLLHWEENFLEGRQHKGHHPRLRGSHRGINHGADTSQRAEARSEAHGCEASRMVTWPLLVTLISV